MRHVAASAPNCCANARSFSGVSRAGRFGLVTNFRDANGTGAAEVKALATEIQRGGAQ